jgi:hypothetical protein
MAFFSMLGIPYGVGSGIWKKLDKIGWNRLVIASQWKISIDFWQKVDLDVALELILDDIQAPQLQEICWGDLRAGLVP